MVLSIKKYQCATWRCPIQCSGHQLHVTLEHLNVASETEQLNF